MNSVWNRPVFCDYNIDVTKYILRKYSPIWFGTGFQGKFVDGAERCWRTYTLRFLYLPLTYWKDCTNEVLEYRKNNPIQTIK